MNQKPLILDGRKIRDERKEFLKKRVEEMSVIPSLTIFQLGEDQASDTYIRQKEIFGKSIGVKVNLVKFGNSVSTEDLIQSIYEENNKNDTHGIIVQFPLPENIDPFLVSQSIVPEKDIDGFSPKNIRSLFSNSVGFVPATTRGILSLLDYYGIKIAGKKVCVIGRSELVGKPTAIAFLNRDATVSICHSKTENLERETQNSDILVVAVGKPNMIGKNHINKDHIVVDVGITRGIDGKLCGDADFREISQIVSAITPVPGGVGPMTVLSLFENLCDSAESFVRKGVV